MRIGWHQLDPKIRKVVMVPYELERLVIKDASGRTLVNRKTKMDVRVWNKGKVLKIQLVKKDERT